jgi:acetyl-CoA C-acetyltransferase
LRKTVIVSAARTPFGRFGGSLSSLTATDLGGKVIKEALERASISGEQVDNVIMGMVLQGGAGQIPSRQATRKAGLPWEVPSETINKVCASGLRAVTMGDQQIRSGDAGIVVAGGMESMSNAPYFIKGARWGYRMGDSEVVDLMIHDGLWCSFHNRHMAVHGSVLAAEYAVSREAQDEWALRSQERAAMAIKTGKFKAELVTVTVAQRKADPIIVDTDECPRPETTLAALAKLPPVFTKEGSITSGNAPGISDGAGAVVLMAEEMAPEMGLQPLATIVGHCTVAAEAANIATVPGLATLKLLEKVGMSLGSIDLIESNEAFAAVSLISGKIARWNPDKVNVNGGAIALGHPIGASGARILMSLIFELRRRGGGYGIATICSGAAQGDAILVRVE